jgi:hypothetical protein
VPPKGATAFIEALVLSAPRLFECYRINALSGASDGRPSGEKRTRLCRARLSPDTRGNSMFSHGICYFEAPPFVSVRLQPFVPCVFASICWRRHRLKNRARSGKALQARQRRASRDGTLTVIVTYMEVQTSQARCAAGAGFPLQSFACRAATPRSTKVFPPPAKLAPIPSAAQRQWKQAPK